MNSFFFLIKIAVFILVGVMMVQYIEAQPSIILSKTIGGTGMESIHDLITDADGHLIALCSVDSIDSDSMCGFHGGASDIMMIKMDMEGNIIWEHCYGGSDDDEPYQLIQTTDSGFLFTGTTLSNDGDVTDNHGSNDIWIVKTDTMSNIKWQRTVGSSSGDNP